VPSGMRGAARCDLYGALNGRTKSLGDILQSIFAHVIYSGQTSGLRQRSLQLLWVQQVQTCLPTPTTASAVWVYSGGRLAG
jgi:hypothetical protein